MSEWEKWKGRAGEGEVRVGIGKLLHRKAVIDDILGAEKSVSNVVSQREGENEAYKEVLSSGRNAESSMNIVALARCKAPALCKCSKISAAS